MDLVPIDHDPFGDGAPSQGGGPLRITVRPAGSGQPELVPVDHDPFADTQPGYTEDMVKGLAAGVGKGVSGLVGLPRFASDQIGSALDWLEQSARQEGDTEFANRVAERKAKIGNVPTLLPKSSTVRGAMEGVTGPLYEPKTIPGKFAGAVGEFVPGALAGPGGVGRNLINFALVPGVTSEATRELTKGTSAEAWAPVVAAIAAGGGASVLNRPATAERAIRGGMSAGVTPQHVTQAEQLMNDAAQRGVRLTWAEALEQVAPGSGLTTTQRIVESSPGGSEVMAPFMAQRPAQMENAARQTFNNIAPPNRAPSGIGPAVGEAAEGRINAVRQRINRVAEPYYDRASTVLLTPQEMARVRAIPGFQEARDTIRNTPQLNRYVQHLPDDSVGFLNEVKKQLDTASTNATPTVMQRGNHQIAAGYGRDAGAVRDAAVNATLGNPARNLETALNIESVGRQRFLEPLLNGPLGKLAQRDQTTKQAIESLFPANPVANSEREITTAVSALARRNPRAARDLVRAHAEATFNEAAQNLQSGANQFGGAKFTSTIAGNPQQRANLEAAVQALPNGNQIWTGFERFLEIAQATGTRQPKGSLTAFNQQAIKDASSGGMIAGGAKMAASPNKLLSAVSDAWGRWQYGRNMDQLAQILTDPRSGNILRAIASRPVGARESQILAGQLVLGANTARQGGANGK